MPTCCSNFDTLPTCDYHRLCAVCPPLPHRYSNIENRWKSLPSRSKHSLFQKPLSHSHPACSPKITQCHSQESLKITHSLTPIVHANRTEEDSFSVQLWQEDSLLGIALRFTWLGFESLRSCMQTDLRKIKIIASVLFNRCR